MGKNEKQEISMQEVVSNAIKSGVNKEDVQKAITVQHSIEENTKEGDSRDDD